MTEIQNRVIAMVEAKPNVEIADARPPEFSDEALAQRFADRHNENLRYVAVWGRWYAWDGTRWAPDDTLDAFDRARAVCRAAASQANKHQAAIASAKTVAAIERLAKSDRRIAAAVEQWDGDLDIFNNTATEGKQL